MRTLLAIWAFTSLGLLLACVSSKHGNPAHAGEEVIDNGYTTMSKRNSTSSSQSIEFENEVGSLDQYLARVSGVMVQGSGPNAQIRIRGLSHSFIGGSSPLFVVNGSRVGTSYAAVASMVNAQDIKRVTVLKDPNDTAIYGSAGANGVIVIQLKGTTGRK